jgi:hypothetical protein
MDIGEKSETTKLPEIGTPPAEPSIGIELLPSPSFGVKVQLVIETGKDDQPTEQPRKYPAKEPSIPDHETEQEPTQEDTMENLYSPGSLGSTLS